MDALRFSSTNGSTEVVAGSHLTGAHPNQEDQSIYPIIQPEAEAGTLMVFDGRLWHGTGSNTGNSDRVGVLTTFCSPQFRQQENQTLGLDRDLFGTNVLRNSKQDLVLKFGTHMEELKAQWIIL